MATDKKLEDQHLDAAENVFNDLSEQSESHSKDPKEHIHVPADHDKARSWFRAVFPYNSLEEFEAQWHLGNYVIDRQTGQKSWEPMSIYVRLGMHLLYYGSEQENLLQSRRAQEMLKAQSIKMGKQYDSPESKNHIQPFIESFHLQGTLDELVCAFGFTCSSRTRLTASRSNQIPKSTAPSTSFSPAKSKNQHVPSPSPITTKQSQVQLIAVSPPILRWTWRQNTGSKASDSPSPNCSARTNWPKYSMAAPF